MFQQGAHPNGISSQELRGKSPQSLNEMSPFLLWRVVLLDEWPCYFHNKKFRGRSSGLLGMKSP